MRNLVVDGVRGRGRRDLDLGGPTPATDEVNVHPKEYTILPLK